MKIIKMLYQKLFKINSNEKLGLMRDNAPVSTVKPIYGSKVYTPEETVELKTQLKYNNPTMFKNLFPDE